ncbi:MAG: DUF4835 domain-containing protein [Flavobacteriaceae bacterium]|nr:MAG: DUF4835 domain-containing protein [Flavobacteriaceae bacterium]
MRKIFLVAFMLIVSVSVQAQELNCSITINADKIPGSNKQVFKTLENALNEFVNRKKWTPADYKIQERIVCNMTITITEYSGDSFKGNIQIQASRPVYGSVYLTPVFNFKDDYFSFNYTEYQPLQYSKDNFDSNLESLITFYVYTILGMDADSFAPSGGTKYFETAQNILVLAQQSGFKGWNQNDGNRTRFTLVDNLLSSTYSDFRSAMYIYHRKGMDIMASDSKTGKAFVSESIQLLKKVYDSRPEAFLLRVFMDSKANEITEIFSDGPTFNTSQLRNNLQKISPLHADNWVKIK